MVEVASNTSASMELLQALVKQEEPQVAEEMLGDMKNKLAKQLAALRARPGRSGRPRAVTTASGVEAPLTRQLPAPFV